MTHTVSDQIKALIERLSPQPVCDECITERLGLPDAEPTSHKTRELAGMAGFESRIDSCSLCASEKKVIRRKA